MATRNSIHGIGILLYAQNRVSGPVQAAAQSFMNLTQTVQQSGETMNSSLNKVVNFGLSGVKGIFNNAIFGGQFDQSLAAIKSITKATEEEMARLHKAAIEGSLDTKFSPKESVEALTSLAQAGLSANEAILSLRPSLDLAAASLGKLDPRIAAETIFQAQKAFGMTAADSNKIMNTLVEGTNMFKIHVHELPQMISKVSRGAFMTGQSMEDTIIALGMVKNFSKDAASAATLTSSAMLRLSRPETQDTLTKLGVTFQDQAGNFLPLVQIMYNFNEALQNKFPKAVDRAAIATKTLMMQAAFPFAAIIKQMTDGITTQDRFAVGFQNVSKDQKQAGISIIKGAEAFQFFQMKMAASRGELELIPEKFKGLRDLANQVQKMPGWKPGMGTGDQFIKNLQDTFYGRFELVRGAVETIATLIGQAFGKALYSTMDNLFKVLSIIARFIEQMNPRIKSIIADFVIWTTVIGTLTVAVIALGFAIQAVMASALMASILNPVTGPFVIGGLLIIVGIITVIAGLITMWKNDILGVYSIFSNLWEGFKKGFGDWDIAGSLSVLAGHIISIKNSIYQLLVNLGLISEKPEELKNSFASNFFPIGYIVGSVVGGMAKAIIFLTNVIVTMVDWLAYAMSYFTSGYIASFFKFVFNALPSASSWIDDKLGLGKKTVPSPKQEIVPSQMPTANYFTDGLLVGSVPPQSGSNSIEALKILAGALGSLDKKTQVEISGSLNADGESLGSFFMNNIRMNKTLGLSRSPNQVKEGGP